MRPEELAKLSATIEYGRAKYRLSRVSNPDVRERYEEIVREYEEEHPELAPQQPQPENTQQLLLNIGREREWVDLLEKNN